MNFRTDPLTDEGKIDMDFFASDKYQAEKEILIAYLYAEGFNLKKENFFIDFGSRKWHIILKNTKKKK